MNLLIVYGTTEGQTRKIAERVATIASERGHLTEVHDAGEQDTNLDLDAFDAVIVAASVHQQQHQDSVTNFVAAHKDQLSASCSAFISVSFSAVLEETRPEAQRYVDRFVSLTGWQPRMALLLGGAVRFAEYDYFQEQIVRFIVMRGGFGPADGADREFTDWNALEAFVDACLDMASG